MYFLLSIVCYILSWYLKLKELEAQGGGDNESQDGEHEQREPPHEHGHDLEDQEQHAERDARSVVVDSAHDKSVEKPAQKSVEKSGDGGAAADVGADKNEDYLGAVEKDPDTIIRFGKSADKGNYRRGEESDMAHWIMDDNSTANGVAAGGAAHVL